MGIVGNRFELEQQIMDCWHIVDDLKVLSEATIENDDMTMDKVSNITIGLEQLYQLKFEKLFELFEENIRQQYNQTEEVIDALRDKEADYSDWTLEDLTK